MRCPCDTFWYADSTRKIQNSSSYKKPCLRLGKKASLISLKINWYSCGALLKVSMVHLLSCCSQKML